MAAAAGILERDEALGRIFRIARSTAGSVAPVAYCLKLVAGQGPRAMQSLVDGLDPAWSEYAIASVYTLLLGGERRRTLGAYFTPPHLVDHLIARMRACGLDILGHVIHDPAAGGAAFVVPLVRAVMAARIGAGEAQKAALADVAQRLAGREIDHGLADVANALVRRMLLREFGLRVPREFALVAHGDTLRDRDEEAVDAWVGNPPYAKIGTAGERRWRREFADIARGHLNLYAMFLRRGLDRVRPGGLLGFIVPTSFIGSPDYAPFRRRLSELAQILSVDLIEKRSRVFLDVVQDACFVVVRRHPSPAAGSEPEAIQDAPIVEARAGRPLPDAPSPLPGAALGGAGGAKAGVAAALVACGVVRAEGGSTHIGLVRVPADGSAWQLPALDGEVEGGAILADYGYRAKVGFLVPGRHPARLHAHKRTARHRFPLAWAKAVGPNGTFDITRALEHHEARGRIWVDAAPDAPYLERRPLVVVQRTSNRKQVRRINAAAVPKAFFDEHGGLVGENHVLMLVPASAAEPLVSPEDLAALLNSGPVNERFARVCGTVTVSAQLIAQLDLPRAATVRGLATLSAQAVDQAVRAAYGDAATQRAEAA